MESWVWALIGFVAGIIVYAIINLIIAKDPSEELENLADERAAELAKAEMKTAVLQDKLLEAETARDQQRDKSEAEYQQKLAHANAEYQEKLAQAEASHQQDLATAADEFEHKLAVAEAAHREKLALVEQQFGNLENAFQQQAAEVAATLAAAGMVSEATAEVDDGPTAEDDASAGEAAPEGAEMTADELAMEEAAAAIALTAVDGDETLLEPIAPEADEAEQAGVAFEAEVVGTEDEAADMVPPAEQPAEEESDSAVDDETSDGPGPAGLVAAAAGGAVVAAALSEDDDQDQEADRDEGVVEAINSEGEEISEMGVASAEKPEATADDPAGLDADESAGPGLARDSEDKTFQDDVVAATGVASAAVLAAAGDDQDEISGQQDAEIDELMAEIAGLEEADELAELDRLEQTDVMADLEELDALDGAPEASEAPAVVTAEQPEITNVEAGEAADALDGEFDTVDVDEMALDEAEIEEPELDEAEIEEPELDEAEFGEIESDTSDQAAVAAAAVAAELDPAPDLAQDEPLAEPEPDMSEPMDAEADLAESAWPADTSVWTGEYFNNMKLEGEPVLVREDPEIDFDWGMGSPAPEIDDDGFSVRWTRTADLPPGLYRFTVTSDDGARLWVNDRLVISAWYDHTEMTFRREMELAGGPVDLRLEYYENAMEALIRVSWERIG